MNKGYYTVTKITDCGPRVTKIVLPVDDSVSSVSKEEFSVFAERLNGRGEILYKPAQDKPVKDAPVHGDPTQYNPTQGVAMKPDRGYVKVKNAYPSSQTGDKKEKSDFIALELEYSPGFSLTSRMYSRTIFNEFAKLRYTIKQAQADGTSSDDTRRDSESACWDYPLDDCCPEIRDFRCDRFTFESETLNYAYYIPQKFVNNTKCPLIIWLHGIGEGGNDPRVTYTGNKAPAFASEKVQTYFSGAYVLLPQAQTFWMDDGSRKYTEDGKSKYTEILKRCIDSFLDKNPNIDRNRIYIGGASNGGFMTMRLIIDYPDFFAAAFPASEVMYSDFISDEQIRSITHMPIWFTHSKNDPVVDPYTTSLPTYKRLIEAGAKNVHFTFWDAVKDVHEGFVDKDGNAFEYMGHLSWLYLFNDDCKLDYDKKPVMYGGKEVTLLQWLSMQKKQ